MAADAKQTVEDMIMNFQRLERRREKLDEASAAAAQREARREEKTAKDRVRVRGIRIGLERALGRAAEQIGLLGLPIEDIEGAIYTLEDGVTNEKERARWRAKRAERVAVL